MITHPGGIVECTELDERVVLAEFYPDDSRDEALLHSLTTADGHRHYGGAPTKWNYDEYDVEYCRRDDEYYRSECGGGGPPFEVQLTIDKKNQFWAAPGVEVFVREYNPRTKKDKPRVPLPPENRLITLPPGWTEERLLDITNVGRIYYCPRCKDFLPDEGHICDHIGDCLKCGRWNEPEDPCKCVREKRAARQRRKLGIKRRKTTKAVFEAEGTVLFGPNKDDWRFICPKCKRAASVKQYKTLCGTNYARYAGQLCISRFFKDPKADCGLCKYHELNPVVIVPPPGASREERADHAKDPVAYFEFALRRGKA